MVNSIKIQAVKRSRLVYGLLAGSVMLLGLASRRYFGEVAFIKNYVGDALWALMVFFCYAVVFSKWSTKTVSIAATVTSFGIEISQLYHAPWIDQIRATRLGALVLGFTFVWSDFICYSIGVLIGVVVEVYLMPDQFTKAR